MRSRCLKSFGTHLPRRIKKRYWRCKHAKIKLKPVANIHDHPEYSESLASGEKSRTTMPIALVLVLVLERSRRTETFTR